MASEAPNSSSGTRRFAFFRRRAVVLPVSALVLIGAAGGAYVATSGSEPELVVAGETIDQGLMSDMVDESMELMKNAPVGSAPPDQQRAGIQDLVATQLSALALLRREARERGISITDNDLRRARASLGIPDGMKTNTKREQITLDFMVLSTKFRQILLRENPPDLSDAAVKKWYEKNKDQFHTPRHRTVFAVETTTKADAQAVIAQAAANEPLGELFERYADKTSATYASRGAFTIEDGKLSPRIVQTVMDAPDKRWVGPIANGKRWLVVFTSDSAQEETTLSLSDSRANVKEAILNRHADGLWQDFIAELRRKYAKETRDPEGQLPTEINVGIGSVGPAAPPAGFGPDDPPPPPPAPSPKTPAPETSTVPQELIAPPPPAP